jgi:hypothetical protein
MPNITQIPAPRVPVIETNTGLMTTQWFRYFNNINTIVGGGTGVTPPESGGTGTGVAPVNGQILIGNNLGSYTVAYLTPSAGLFSTVGNGALTVGISNTTVTPGAYGSASSVTTLTVNARGQLTVAGSVAISIAATQITSGVIASSLISGSYTGITGVGTLTAGTWTAAIIGVAYGGTGLSSLTVNRIPYGNGTAAYQSSANLTYDGSIFTAKANIVVNKTITASGTTGAQTINQTSGSVNFAALATSLVVTNSLVTTSSIIMATVASNDATMKSVQAVAAAGSFTLYANAGATAETRVNFLVLN